LKYLCFLDHISLSINSAIFLPINPSPIHHASDSLLGVKRSPGTVVKLLPCDHEVMGSCPGNSLLQKRRGRLRA
jgi:hypothetical protein